MVNIDYEEYQKTNIITDQTETDKINETKSKITKADQAIAQQIDEITSRISQLRKVQADVRYYQSILEKSAANPTAYQETDYLRQQIDIVKKERATGWEAEVSHLQEMINKQEAVKNLSKNKIGKDKKEENQRDLDEVEVYFDEIQMRLESLKGESLEGEYTQLDNWLNEVAMEEEKQEKATRVKTEQELQDEEEGDLEEVQRVQQEVRQFKTKTKLALKS